LINPMLFAKLQAVFGEDRVKLQAENVPIESWHEKHIREGKVRVRLRKKKSGEEYFMCCPFCTDTRHRLSVNHMWGKVDPQNGTKNLWLAQCFNNDCLADYETRLKFFHRVKDAVPVNVAKKQQPKKREKIKVGWPGAMWNVTDICNNGSKHVIVDYLSSKLLTPSTLGEQYNLAYCVDSKFRYAGQRLVVPIYLDGKMVSYQCRSLDADRPKKVPKWWTCPDTTVADFLYNFDVAKEFSTIGIVEGPPDVWGLGKQSVGVFKNKLSDDQMSLLHKVADNIDCLAVLFDPKQDSVSIEKGKPHHVEVAYEKLNNDSRFRDKVVKVYLPNNFDPGETDRDYTKQLVKRAARLKGIKATFGAD
jgi:hypothetical protein